MQGIEEWNKDIMNDSKTNPLFYYKMLEEYEPPKQNIADKVRLNSNKIAIFALPIDFEILTDISEIYEPLWS